MARKLQGMQKAPSRKNVPLSQGRDYGSNYARAMCGRVRAQSTGGHGVEKSRRMGGTGFLSRDLLVLNPPLSERGIYAGEPANEENKILSSTRTNKIETHQGARKIVDLHRLIRQGGGAGGGWA